MFKSETEVEVKNGEKIVRGFIDSDFKNILIEYKRYQKLDSDTDRTKAQRQLEEYMKSPSLSKFPILYGFLTDGKTFYSYKKEGSSFERLEEFSGYLDEYKLDYFLRCLVNYDRKDITPFSLKEDFAIINNKTDKTTTNLFLELLNIKNSSKNDRTKLLFSEWEKLFKLSEADNSNNEEVAKRRKALSSLIGRDIIDASDEYNVIFAIHTLYSLIIKLIAIKAAKENSETYNTDFYEISKYDNAKLLKFIKSIETGNIFKRMNILNMIEGDFFSWYITEALTDEFYNNFRDLCFKLSKYETFSVKLLDKTQDFFRELYESCVPAEIRHSFGEFYTPYWLADGVVIDYINRKSIKDIYKSLDPTCGSGTFVMVNMDKVIDFINKHHAGLSNKEKTEIILSNCYGIDLNPLAVLSSKINYFMNIASVYDGTYQIEIPIYLGDSSYMPQTEILDGVKCISYDFFTDVEAGNDFIHFCLPLSLINDKNFITYMDELEAIIIGQEEDRKKSKQAKNYLISKIEKSSLNIKVEKEIEDLINKLVELESKKLNSIWLRIFANYLKSSSLCDMDLISGNPPWVDWKNLPDKYSEKLKISCKNTGIFSNDKNVGGISLNICALIAMKCCDKYLKEDGELSFLMPDGILYNKSFEGFRNFEIDGRKYYFKKIVDWSKAGKPFDPVAINFCCFTISKDKQDYTNGIPFVRYSAKKGAKFYDTHAVFETEKDKLNVEDMFAYMINTKSNNPFTILDAPIPNIDKIVGEKQYRFRKGLGLKAEVHKLVYANECPTDNTLAYFYTFEKGNKYKSISKNKVLLEKKYVRPLIETPCLTFYQLDWDNEYTVFPYEWGTKTPIPFEELKKKAPHLAQYLLNNKEILNNQSEYNKRIQNTSEFYGIIRTADYMFRDNFVCIKDNGQLVATPVNKVKTHWGEDIIPVFDGHVSYISEKLNDTPISSDEMYFISGILNCPHVKKFVEASSSSQSIGTKFDINLPQYDDANSKHIEILKAVKEVISLIKKKNNLLEQIVAENEANDYMKQKDLLNVINQNKKSETGKTNFDNLILDYNNQCSEINTLITKIQDLYISI